MTVGRPANSIRLRRTREQLVDDKPAHTDHGDGWNPTNDSKQEHTGHPNGAALYPADQLAFGAGVVDVFLGVDIKIGLRHQAAAKCGFSISPIRFPNGSATVATRIPSPTS